MVTKQDCLTHRYFRYLGGTYSRSKELKQVRASGKCQTWKTRPDDFKLPVKYGMYESLYITPENAAMFITEDEYQQRKEQAQAVGQVLKNPRKRLRLGKTFHDPKVPARIGEQSDIASATIRRNRDGEYVVRLYKNGKHYEPADYFTNDADDAIATARLMIKGEKGELKMPRTPAGLDDDAALIAGDTNPSKVRPLGANQTEVETDDGARILFSYQTPVAAHIPGYGYFRTDKKWSRTTSKHIGTWLAANGARTVGTMSQEKLDALLTSSGQFRKNPTLRAKRSYAPKLRAHYDTSAKQKPAGNFLHVQQKKGAMWFTLAVVKNSHQGREKARMWANHYHRKHPGSTLRLFV